MNELQINMLANTSPAYYTALLSIQFSLSKGRMLSFVISEKHTPASHSIMSLCVISSSGFFADL